MTRPLATLGLHAILDVAEDMIMAGCKDEKERRRILNALYLPKPGDKDGGFDERESAASFDAFEAMAAVERVPEARKPTPAPARKR